MVDKVLASPKSIGARGGQMTPKSECCNADYAVAGKTTHWYVCQECGKPCDLKIGDAQSLERADVKVGIIKQTEENYEQTTTS